MGKRKFILSPVLISVLFFVCSHQNPATQDWTHFARIAGHGLNLKNIDRTIQDAKNTYLFGIEVDNDIPGRYDSYLNPDKKLEAIRVMAKKAHKINNYAFVYIAGLECITANADKSEHSFFKDHPDWVQRDIHGRPAVFGGGTAFWIARGDEDVWISPYVPDWRKIYMERVSQIAGTGIDGIYVDIPYWMTHFDGWENTWASFDDYTVAEFERRTGLNAKTDLRLGDFKDANFRKWVDFRISTITEFMKEIDENVKAVNPNCKTIAEIYPGLGEDAVRIGADVYQLYDVVDVIAHEYSAGEYMASDREPLDWLTYMIGMFTFRSFAGKKASWMLSYSWDGEKNIEPAEAMRNLAMSQVVAGTNFWDAEGHVMSGSNDIKMREKIFSWIAEYEKVFYSPRMSLDPIGVYFSPKTRNYFVKPFIESFNGIMHLLVHSHLEFQIITPRTLADFKGKVLILPDVKCLSDREILLLKKFVKGGHKLLAIGELAKYNYNLVEYVPNPLQNIASARPDCIVVFNNDPGRDYMKICRDEFDKSAHTGDFENMQFEKQKNAFVSILSTSLGFLPDVKIDASPFVLSQICDVAGKIHVFFANFKGLQGRKKAVQIPEENVKVELPAAKDTKVKFLPFLGSPFEIKGTWKNGKIVCTIPKIEKGGVLWVE